METPMMTQTQTPKSMYERGAPTTPPSGGPRPRRDRLSAKDRSDLEAYAEVLRPYYGIPDGQPVFPDQQPEPRRRRNDEPAADGRMKLDKSKPRATGINSDDHPWRGTL